MTVDKVIAKIIWPRFLDLPVCYALIRPILCSYRPTLYSVVVHTQPTCRRGVQGCATNAACRSRCVIDVALRRRHPAL